MAASVCRAMLGREEGVIPVTVHAQGLLHWPRRSTWLAGLGAVVILFAAVVAGVLLGRGTKSAGAPEGLASQSVVAAIDDSLAALNRGDWKSFAAGWAKNAVYVEPGIAGIVRGRRQIVELSRGYHRMGALYYRTGPVIQRGDLAAYAIECPPCPAPGGWHGIDLVKFDKSLKVVRYWTGYTAGPAPK